MGTLALAYQLLAGVVPDRLIDLLLDRVEVEGCRILHRRVVDGGLREGGHPLLDEDEPPELVGIPIVVVDRLVQASSLERVQPKINEDGPVRLNCAAKPTVRLIEKPVFEIVNANRAKRRFGKVNGREAIGGEFLCSVSGGRLNQCVSAKSPP